MLQTPGAPNIYLEADGGQRVGDAPEQRCRPLPGDRGPQRGAGCGPGAVRLLQPDAHRVERLARQHPRGAGDPACVTHSELIQLMACVCGHAGILAAPAGSALCNSRQQ